MLYWCYHLVWLLQEHGKADRSDADGAGGGPWSGQGGDCGGGARPLRLPPHLPPARQDPHRCLQQHRATQGPSVSKDSDSRFAIASCWIQFMTYSPGVVYRTLNSSRRKLVREEWIEVSQTILRCWILRGCQWWYWKNSGEWCGKYNMNRGWVWDGVHEEGLNVKLILF